MGARMSVSERIWAGSLGGLFDGLAEARSLEANGQFLRANVMRASVWYSYRFVPGALGRAVACVQQLRRTNIASFSAEQCDVIGTIMFAAGEIDCARSYYEAGLAKETSPHQRALLLVGRAEVVSTVKNAESLARNYLDEALNLEEDAEKEQNRVQAMRQFTRVLRRATVLLYRFRDYELGRLMYDRAWLYAYDPEYGSRSQRWKLRWTWFTRLS